MITETLQSLSYQIDAFDSSEAVFSEWSRDTHIALLDVNLPSEDGLYLAQRLRLESLHIGIIIMTVRNQITDKLAGFEAGGDVYLPKPVALIQALARRIPVMHAYDLRFHFDTFQLINKNLDFHQMSVGCLRLSHSPLKIAWKTRN